MGIDQPIAGPTTSGPSRGEAAAFAVAAVLLVLATRLPTLGRQAFWYDEILTFNSIALGWGELAAERLMSGHFPTYFALLKLLGLEGGSEFLLRLPSTLFGALTAAIFAVIGLRLGGRVVALLMILFYVCSPVLLYYDQEARPYAMMLFFLAVATVAQLRMLAGGSTGAVITATIASIAAALTVPAAIVSVAAMQFALLVSRAGRESAGAGRRLKLHIVITWAVIILSALLLVPSVVRLLSEPRGLMKWQQGTTPGFRLMDLWESSYGLYIRADPHRFLPRGRMVPALAFVALALAGAVIGWPRAAIRYLGATVALTGLFYCVLAAFTATNGRYMLGMLPPSMLLASFAASWLVAPGRFRVAGGVAVAAVMVLLGLHTLDASFADQRYDIRKMARFLAQSDIGSAEIFTDTEQAGVDLLHYLPSGNGLTFTTTERDSNFGENLTQAAGTHETAWLILFFWRQPLPAEAIKGRRVCRWDFGAADLLVLTPDPGRLPAPLRSCPDGTAG